MKEFLFPFDEPNISSAGSYFRTAPMVNAMAENIIVWREAIEHPLSNKWQIQECHIIPNLMDVQSESLIQTNPIEGKQGVTMGEAIRDLATFEHSSLKMEYKFHKLPKSFGDEHFEVFAGLNGFVLDVNDRVHVLHEGRPVTKGLFSPETLDKAKANQARDPKKKPAVVDTDLSHIFKIAAQSDHFDHLLNLEREKALWRDVVGTLHDCIHGMFSVHDRGFRIEKKGTFMNTVIQETWENKDDYDSAVKNARTSISKTSLITKSDRDKYEHFFDLIQLSLEVSAAKTYYKRHSNSLDKNGHNKIKEQRKIAEKQMKKIGASERDIRKMNALIIDGGGKNDYRHEKLWESSTYESWRPTSAFFVPDEIVLFYDGLQRITNQLEVAIDQQKERMLTPAANSNKDVKKKRTPKKKVPTHGR